MIGFRLFVESNKVRTLSTVRKIVTDYRNSPMYIVFGGTFGAGKTTFAREHFSDITKIIDYDDIAQEFAGGTENIELLKLVGTPALKAKNSRIEGMFASGQTFVEVTTMKDLHQTVDKLKKAKAKGFTTMMVFISTSPEEAMRRNKQRLAAGKRGIEPHKIQLFYDAYYDSVHTFNSLKNSKLVDFTYEVKS